MRTALVGAALSALTFLALEAGMRIASGSAFAPAYLALLGSLTLAASGLAGAAMGALGGGSVAGAGVWAVVEAAHASTGAGPLRAVTAAALFAAGLGLARGLSSPPGRSALGTGVGVGVAAFAALALWPRFTKLAGLDLRGWIALVASAGVFATALIGLAAWERFRDARPRLPAAALLASGAAIAALLGIDLLVGRSREATARPEPSGPARAAGPDILVLVLDTVRADHLSVYGYARETTPSLEEFLARHPRAVRFPEAFSPSNWTIPSHASLLTGSLPSDHGAHFGNSADLETSALVSPTVAAERTVAEVLEAQGYRNGAVLANTYLMRVRDLDRGFHHWEQPPPVKPLGVLAERIRALWLPTLFAHVLGPTPVAGHVSRRALAFLDACGERPCFLLANYMEAHTPYAPRPDVAGRFSRDARAGSLHFLYADDEPDRAALARDLYDEEILALDADLGAFLAEFERRGRLDDAWVFITSDHGEAFGEHAHVSHGSALYQEQVRIPLIVLPPRGVRLPEPDGPVDLLDVAATVTAIAGADPLGAGRDLRQPGRRPVRLEFFGRGRNASMRLGPLTGEAAAAVVDGEWKLIEHAGRRELYNLAEDPSALRDRADREDLRLRQLASELPPLRRGDPAHTSEPVPLDPDEEEALRALGYLE